MRIDVLLVKWGLVPSRSKAQELIRQGEVEILRQSTWQSVKDSSLLLAIEDRERVRLKSDTLLRYVSRGGLKLESALDHFKLDVTGAIVLDVGISTGGFSDCLLQAGAKHIIGIDVGSGQLAQKLELDDRVKQFEHVNARDLRSHTEIVALLSAVDLCVIDVSFISLTLVLPEIADVLPPHRLLALIKPQFELSAADLDKNGIVKDAAKLEEAQERIRQAAISIGYKVDGIFPSRWPGGDGNQEYFISATTLASPGN